MACPPEKWSPRRYSELTVAALLGHASRGVTQRYVHLDKAVQLAAEEVCRTISGLLAE